MISSEVALQMEAAWLRNSTSSSLTGDSGRSNTKIANSKVTQKAVLKDAIHFARHEGAKGHEAHVLLQGNDKLYD
jgi:hypothetical protein